MSISNNGFRDKKRIDSILAVAEDKVKRNALTQLNISEIAKELKISRGIIYYYFENEENLISKIIANKMELLLQKIRNIPPQKNGLEELKYLCKEFHNFLKQHAHYLNLIPHSTSNRPSNQSNHSKDYHSEYEDKRKELFSLCLKSIEKGIEDGSVYPIAEPNEIMYTLWATIGSFWQHININNLSMGKSKIRDVDKLLNVYFGLIFRGLER